MKLIRCTCSQFGGECKADATQEDFLCDPCREYTAELKQLDSGKIRQTGVHTKLETDYHAHMKGMTEKELVWAAQRTAWVFMTAGVEGAYMAEELDLANGRDGRVIEWASAHREYTTNG